MTRAWITLPSVVKRLAGAVVTDNPECRLKRAEEITRTRAPDYQLAIRTTADSRIQTTYVGKTLQGEEGSESVANLVVLVLRERGETWDLPTRPTGPETGIDFLAMGPNSTLAMQVTRVPVDPGHYQMSRRAGYVERTMSPEDCASDLIKAVRKKGCRGRPADHSRMMLVLDGTRQFGYDLPETLRIFHERHLEEARSFGFDDITLVGVFRMSFLLSPPHGQE